MRSEQITSTRGCPVVADMRPDILTRRMSEVWAIIVTRNRAALLQECIAGLRAQSRAVARILLVDSASTDGTHGVLEAAGVLDDPRVVYERLERNRGSAGGYGHGIEHAAAAGADWLWIMD